MYIKEHNKKAYREVKRAFHLYERACVVAPTGSGKSYIALQLLEEYRDKNILFITSQVATLSRFIKLANDELGITESEFDSVLYAGLKSFNCNNEYDYIILDEFHRSGADIWGEGVKNLLETNSAAKVLGLSATPIRYLDDMRDMSDEIFGGNIAYEMTLAEAIAKGILPWPNYIVGMYRINEYVNKLEKRIKASPLKNNTKLAAQIKKAKQKVNEAPGLEKIFGKNIAYPNGHYIVFCPNLEQLETYIDEAEAWFSGVNDEIHIYSMHSKKKNNVKTLNDFIDDETSALKLLYCIDMLNEGIHASGIDGVIMLRSTESPTVYLQQLGRALSAGKSTLPQIIDLMDNMMCLDYLGKLTSDIQQYVLEQGNDYDFSFQIVVELKDIVNELKTIEKQLYFKWDAWYELAKAYYNENGDLLIPLKYEVNGLKLGAWIIDQRRLNKLDKLSEERIKKLEAIGMVWNVYYANDLSWEEKYEYAKKYYEEHSNLLIHRTYEVDGFKLGLWIRNQRVARKENRLNEEQIKRLDDIGMVWQVNLSGDEDWEMKYEIARQYYETHGDLLVHKDHIEDGIALGQWIKTQRIKYKSKTLSVDMIKRLEAIGMVWRVKTNKTNYADVMYQEAKKFYEKNGHLIVAYDYINDGKKLGNWISRKRKEYKMGKLTPEAIKRLEAIGMVWDAISAKWESKYTLAKRYYEKHGDLMIPSNYEEEGIKLGNWINMQKRQYAAGRISADRIAKLEAIGMVWP